MGMAKAAWAEQFVLYNCIVRLGLGYHLNRGFLPECVCVKITSTIQGTSLVIFLFLKKLVSGQNNGLITIIWPKKVLSGLNQRKRGQKGQYKILLAQIRTHEAIPANCWHFPDNCWQH